jgi:CRISPR/Cas system-associated exonuclease Cas4 (RecB family)
MNIAQQIIDYGVSKPDWVALPEKPHTPSNGRIRISSLGRCKYEAAARRLGIPISNPELETDPKKLAMFADGNAVGAKWASCAAHVCEQNGIPFDYEVHVQNEALNGHADIVMFMDGIPVVVEVKHTMYYHPAEAHLVQLRAYMMLLGAQYGCLLYQNRKSGAVSYTPVDRNDAQVNRYLEAHIVAERQVRNDGLRLPRKLLPDQVKGMCCSSHTPPRIAGKAQKGFKKGDEIPGQIVPTCSYWTHCYGANPVAGMITTVFDPITKSEVVK